MDYSQLSDFQINWSVSNYLPGRFIPYDEYVWDSEEEKTFDPCRKPEDAWPIIQRHGISVLKDTGLYLWCAASMSYWVDGVEWQIECDVMHSNPLRAAMIVFLMMQDKANANP